MPYRIGSEKLSFWDEYAGLLFVGGFALVGFLWAVFIEGYFWIPVGAAAGTVVLLAGLAYGSRRTSAREAENARQEAEDLLFGAPVKAPPPPPAGVIAGRPVYAPPTPAPPAKPAKPSGGMRIAARGDASPPKQGGLTPEFVVQAIVTFIVLGIAAWILLDRTFSADDRKWGAGMIGTVVGFWLRGAK